MTMLSDYELAAKVNAYIALNPHATRKQIADQCHASRDRIARLHSIGLVPRWPAARTASQAAMIGARKTPWRRFKLPGSPDTGRVQK